MIIRSAKHEDIFQLSKLKNPKDEQHRLIYEATARNRVEKANNEQLLFLVAEEEGQILGQVFLRLSGNETQAGYPNMQDLHVRVDKRSQGIGKQLIQNCESIAKDLGFGKISVAVNPTLNPRAEALYLSLGYIDIGSEPYLDGVYDGDEDWVIDMVKVLV